jgi:hypothetical protein
MKKIIAAIMSFTFVFVNFCIAGAADNIITNDTFWTDTDGNPIYSQGGGIFKFKDTYYWYGVKYAEAEQYLKAPENGKYDTSVFEAFTCYSSKDLVNWKFESYPMTKETEGMQDAKWVGRMGVAYNENTKKYVLVSQRGGIMFATSDTPEGPYKLVNLLPNGDAEAMPYFENNGTGDQTLFQDDDGKAYLICSNRSGRAHLYVAPLRESDFCDIDADRVKEIYFDEKGEFIKEDGSVGTKDKLGIEGNCMFKYNGNYYFTGSDLYGWNSSHVYVLQAENIMGPYNIQPIAKKKNIPYVMKGTSQNYAHTTQAGFYVTIHGSKQDTVIYCGDRWCDFAGNGIGYNQWSPLSFEGNTPYFNNLSQWTLNADEGTWAVGKDNNYINNPQFEADRIIVKTPVGWDTSDNIDGTANSNIAGKQNNGNFVWQQSADRAYKAELKQEISNLPDGVYTLKAWVKSSGGQKECSLYAISDGNRNESALNIPVDEWTGFETDGIIVENKKCEIGLYSDADASQWVQIDNLSFTKNNDITENITRGKAAKIIAKMLAEKKREDIADVNPSFTDVTDGQYIAYLERNKIISGYADNTFKPDNNITRTECVSMCVRIYQMFEEEIIPNENLTFSDVSNEHWAIKNISNAVRLKWIDAYPDGTFKPNSYITYSDIFNITKMIFK